MIIATEIVVSTVSRATWTISIIAIVIVGVIAWNVFGRK